MAAAFSEDGSLLGIFECPVCMETYDDPRVLACAHQFCLGCLEGIVGTNVSLKCPTCRHETKLGPGKKVADLPRPVLLNELQTKIADLLEVAHNKTTRYCDPCGRKKVEAVTHCHQCRRNFCECCEVNHMKMKMFKSHGMEAISNCVFCDSHPEEVVTAFCEDCKSCLCLTCIMGDHSDHEIEDIHKLADGSRRRLGEFVRRGGLTLDHAEVKVVYKHVSEAEKLRHKFHDSVSQLRGLLKEFEQKLDSLERDTETKLCAEIKNMKLYASDLNDVVISKASLLDYAKQLLEKSLEAELVMKERVIPTSPDGAAVVTPYTTNLPVLADTFTTLCAGMRSLIERCTITYQSHVLGKGTHVRSQTGHSKTPTEVANSGASPQAKLSSRTRILSELPGVPPRKVSPLAGLTETHSFFVESGTTGLAIDTKRQQLVVRTDDKSSPIRVYDYNGQLREEVKKGLIDRVFRRTTSLANNDLLRDIALDNKRSLYLCPGKGALVLVDRAGETTARVMVGSEPAGISYNEEKDVYVVSDQTKQNVHVIDATSRKIVTEFGGHGSGNGEFYLPFHVHVGRVAGISTPVIAVSDWANHRLMVHDIRGGHIKTFGSEGKGEGQLKHPHDVTTDPAGRILVCDSGNKRVVAFWQEGNTDQWRCRLNSKQLGDMEPWFVSCDPQTGVMAVGFNNGHIHMFK